MANILLLLCKYEEWKWLMPLYEYMNTTEIILEMYILLDTYLPDSIRVRYTKVLIKLLKHTL
jgi:hypothetical protein